MFYLTFPLTCPLSREVRVRIQDRNLEIKTMKYLCLLTPAPRICSVSNHTFFSSKCLDYAFSIVSTSAFFDMALRRYVPLLGFFIFLIILCCDFCIMLDGYVTPSGLSFYSV